MPATLSAWIAPARPHDDRILQFALHIARDARETSEALAFNNKVQASTSEALAAEAANALATSQRLSAEVFDLSAQNAENAGIIATISANSTKNAQAAAAQAAAEAQATAEAAIAERISAERISFLPGTIYGEATGSLNLGGQKNYILRALPGQTMTVNFPNKTGDFSVIVRGEDGMLIAQCENLEGDCTGVLPANQDYIVTITAISRGGYTIRITIVYDSLR